MALLRGILSGNRKQPELKNAIISKVLVRFAGYKASPFLEDLGELNTKFETVCDPVIWKYVERILPPTVVPEPIKRNSYPSGWKPQGESVKERPYFVERTKNHMIPIYLKVTQRGERRHTILKRIKGDIWLLESEVKEFLQKQTFKPIRSQVNEFAGYICINGDFVNAIKYWLEKTNL